MTRGQRAIRVALALASSVLFLYTHDASAATIGVDLGVVASDLSGPLMFTIPIGPTEIIAYNALDGGTGLATSITGFASLAGVTPSDLTLSFGDIERLSTTFTPGGCTPTPPPGFINCDTAINTYGEGDAGPNFFDVILAGIGTILSGQVIAVDVVTDTDLSSPGFATATGSGTLLFTSGLAPYFAEMQSLTGGTGVAGVTLNSFDPVCFPGTDPCSFQSSGTLTFVPEPTTAALLGGALAALAMGRRGRKQPSLSRCVAADAP